MNTTTLLLASKSPRRRELLSALGFLVHFVDLNVDEHLTEILPPHRIAESLAIRKSNGFDSAQILDDQILITADTIVVHQDQVLGKPKTREEGVHMLQMLSNDQHIVYTGVCLRNASRMKSFTEKTLVSFKSLSIDEINHYIDNYEYSDKAGAYGIQDWIGMIGITRIEGCYYNVMGLPLARLYKELSDFILTQ